MADTVMCNLCGLGRISLGRCGFTGNLEQGSVAVE